MGNQFRRNMRIGVIGAGIMGKSLIRGMLKANLVEKQQIFAAVNSRASEKEVASELEIQVAVPYCEEWISDTDIFLICVKPHTVRDILKQLKDSGKLNPSTLVISTAAGVTLKQMEEILPNAHLIRAMPNTPCLIGAGVTVVSPGRNATEDNLASAESIFLSVGQCYQLAEKHMNAVTAVSGSGPAYAYLIMESLADGAVKVGLPRDIAFKLVSQTMLGAARMLQETNKHPATLKDEVTTPSGCTISALLTLEDGKIRSTLARAVEEATRIAGLLG